MPTRFPTITARAACLALALSRRPCSEERRARFARVLRYVRARGLRGPSSAAIVRTGARFLATTWSASERF